MKASTVIKAAVLYAVTCCLCTASASLSEELREQSEEGSSPGCIGFCKKSEWLNTLLGSATKGTMNHEANQSAIVLSKRNQNSSGSSFREQEEASCACQSSMSLVDLGQRTYPRYVTSAVCSNSLCRGYGTPCQSIYYITHVLRSKKAQTNAWAHLQDVGPDGEITEMAAVVDTNGYPYTLPGNLSRKWKLDAIRVVAACLCMN